jgi:hypothetical protein
MNVGTFAALPIAAAVLPGCSGVSDPTVSPTDFVVNRAEDAQAVVAAHARHSGHPLWAALNAARRAHGPIASLAQRAAARMSTSRSIANSATCLRRSLSSSRTLSLNRASPPRAR